MQVCLTKLHLKNSDIIDKNIKFSSSLIAYKQTSMSKVVLPEMNGQQPSLMIF